MTDQQSRTGAKYPKPAGARLVILWLLVAIAIASAWLIPGPFTGR